MLFFSEFLDMTQNTNRNVATVCRIKQGQTHPLAVICYPFYFFFLFLWLKWCAYKILMHSICTWFQLRALMLIIIQYWDIKLREGEWKNTALLFNHPPRAIYSLMNRYDYWYAQIFSILNERRKEKKFQTTKLNKRCIIFRVELLMNTKIYIPN